jgi:hypothetical protein
MKRVMWTLRQTILALAAVAALAAGCGDASDPAGDGPAATGGARETTPGEGDQTRSSEPVVTDPAGVRACLIRKDYDLQGYPGLDAAQWWEQATKSLVPEELPQPEIEAWEWQEAFVGFYATAQAATAAEGAVRRAARQLGMPIQRRGNVLRIDDVPSEPAAVGALTACLLESATTDR